MNKMELAEKLIERSRKLGADEAEAFVMDSTEVSISIKDDEPETVNYTDTSGYGIRILVDGRMGFASSNNFDLAEADSVIKRLVSYTRHHTPDEHNVLPAPTSDGAEDTSLDQYDEKLSSIPVEDKIRAAVAIGAAAKAADSRIRQIPMLKYGDSAWRYAIASTRGISGEARRTQTYGVVIALGMDNAPDAQPDPAATQTGIGVEVKASFAQLDPSAIGRKAAHYALRMLGAIEGRTAEIEGVFPPEVGFNFIQLVADMSAADQIQKKKSIYTGKLGEMVASKHVTIIDDGRLEGGLASAAVDMEGVPTTTKEIIRDGKLTQFLYDSYTAHRGKTVSTGNAIRQSFDSKPYIAPTNFYMKPGQMTAEGLIASVKDGLYVTEVSGLHASVDQVSGNFSIPGKGLMIENGELSKPVTNVSISGNIFDFFKGIEAVADDLTWEPREHAIGVPTFKVNRIKISGI
jgi:PmbA protein